MPLRALWAVALCAVALEVCAAPDSAPADATVDARQVLVMLRVPSPHFRPDASYLGSYDMRVGRAARHRVAEELAARFNLRVVDGWPMPALGVDCFVMEAPENAALGRLVEDMALDARVEWVQQVNLFHVLSHNDPLFPLQPTARVWHLAEIHQIATGKNVRVAEIDSGVERDHPDLRGRVAIARNFVDGRDLVAETHGTAVAGIIAAGADDGVGIVGVAPQAVLMALRACWQTPADENAAVCSSFTLAKALQFALDQNAKVINLSLGGPRDRLLGRLLDVAMTRGVVIVAAADPNSSDGGFPASVTGVFAVAADDAHDLPAAILVAPGKDIPTTLPGRRWGLVSGSSFAAAEMAGLIALLLDLAPDQKPQQIRETLAHSKATPSSPDRHAIVDACAAVARTMGACACGCSMVLRDSGPAASQ
jgi:subtilisin family serine protease